ncbi:MAG: hypothetical protein U1F41_13085 [Burkholderiales bacterium]
MLAVRLYVVESADRARWDDKVTAELNQVIRSCVECMGVRRQGPQTAGDAPLDAIRHAVGYVDEHLKAAGAE